MFQMKTAKIIPNTLQQNSVLIGLLLNRYATAHNGENSWKKIAKSLAIYVEANLESWINKLFMIAHNRYYFIFIDFVLEIIMIKSVDIDDTTFDIYYLVYQMLETSNIYLLIIGSSVAHLIKVRKSHKVVRSNIFLCFLEELRIPKSPYEINWPLSGPWVRPCSDLYPHFYLVYLSAIFQFVFGGFHLYLSELPFSNQF